MKKLIILIQVAFLFMTFTEAYSQSGWFSQTSGTTNWLNGVSFTDANNGTALGGSDTLIAHILTQYTENTITNRGSQTLYIFDDSTELVSIPPDGTRTFILGGQTSVTYKQGNQSKTVTTKENIEPTLTLQRIVPYGEDVSVRKIQSTVGYRVTLTDDFPEQLDIKFIGPISVEEVDILTWDVTLDLLKSEDVFNRFTKIRDKPYITHFTVKVKDRITEISFVRYGYFVFGEW